MEETKTTETIIEEELKEEDEVPETTTTGKKIKPVRYNFK